MFTVPPPDTDAVNENALVVDPLCTEPKSCEAGEIDNVDAAFATLPENTTPSTTTSETQNRCMRMESSVKPGVARLTARFLPRESNRNAASPQQERVLLPTG